MSNRSATPTTLGYALLGLLIRGPSTGYALHKVFTTTPMGRYSGSPGAIYPALRRLRRDRLIAPADRPTAARPAPRSGQPLTITKAGRATLNAWLRAPVSTDDIMWRFDEVMLRFAFMDSLNDPNATVSFLTQMRDAVSAHLRGLESFLKQHAPTMPLNGRLALELGVAGFRGHLRWAKRAIAAFQTQEQTR